MARPPDWFGGALSEDRPITPLRGSPGPLARRMSSRFRLGDNPER
jgi:hypothetical protein